MTRDFADFLAALNSEGASYVVIGGMAVLSHVPYRTTRDIDVLSEPTLASAPFPGSSWASRRASPPWWT